MPKNTASVDTDTVRTALDRVFAATYALYFKTHSYHWNVVATDFHSTHLMLEGQYSALWHAIDEIAERYRVFDLPAPNESVSVSAHPYGTSKEDMFRDLLADHDAVIAVLRDSISKLEDAQDAAGADFLTARLAEHEKMAWMLRASLPTVKK
jgi:starvation-inducible DNA-binding protein